MRKSQHFWAVRRTWGQTWDQGLAVTSWANSPSSSLLLQTPPWKASEAHKHGAHEHTVGKQPGHAGPGTVGGKEHGWERANSQSLGSRSGILGTTVTLVSCHLAGIQA